MRGLGCRGGVQRCRGEGVQRWDAEVMGTWGEGGDRGLAWLGGGHLMLYAVDAVV